VAVHVARQHFLAGAGLAGQQDRAIAARDAAREVEQADRCGVDRDRVGIDGALGCRGLPWLL
jgi:hypothetical protein